MRNLDEIKRNRDLNRTFLAGDSVPGIKLRYNTQVEFESFENGERSEGWIVAVEPVEPEPIYTVERCDGSGDEMVAESRIKLMSVAKGDEPIKPRVE